MNIAFPALVILMLIMPGVLLHYYYNKGYWNSPVVINSIQDELIRGVIFSIPVHYFFILLLSLYPDFKSIKYDSLIVVLNGLINSEESGLQNEIILSISKNLWFVIGYFFGVNIFSVFLGVIGHGIVRGLKLDLIIPFFRFDNEWFYLLKGEKFLIDQVSDSKEIIETSKQYLGTLMVYRYATSNIFKLTDEELSGEIQSIKKERLKLVDLVKSTKEKSINSSEKVKKLKAIHKLITKKTQKLNFYQKVSKYDLTRIILHPFAPVKSILKIRKLQKAQKESVIYEVSCIVEQGGESVVYWGVVKGFSFKKGRLYNITLSFAHKCKFNETFETSNSASQERGLGQSIMDQYWSEGENWRDGFLLIPGDYMVIRYDQMKTFNVIYYHLT